MVIEVVTASTDLLRPADDALPGVLRHLAALSESRAYGEGHMAYLHVYATPSSKIGVNRLEFIRAAETGTEGIACIDDVARAVILACQVYEQEGSLAARHWADLWLNFVLYMQGRDGRFTNFILDRAGRRNRRGRTSHAAGQWWNSRALSALAVAWRVFGDQTYRDAFDRGRLAGTPDLKITAVQALALMEMYQAEPSDKLQQRIVTRCDRILAGGRTYLRDRARKPTLQPWGYHQLRALARAGRLFSRGEYLRACEQTIRRVITPLGERDFAETKPWEHAPMCAYDISSMVQGLEETYYGTHNEEYRDQALAFSEWLYGHNAAGTAIYDPRTGCCADGIDNGVVSPHCGAESAVEAGFVEMARRRLR